MCAAKNSFKRIAKSKKLRKFASLSSDDTLDQDYKVVQRGRSAEQLSKLTTDPNTKKDLNLGDLSDGDILFPYDASKRLANQVEMLLEENGQLRRSLVEAEARLKGVVTKCPPALGLHGRASDLAASKIVELSKKVRELTADLEVAKMRCRAFELSSITPSEPESPKKKEPCEDTVKTQETEIKELSDKLSSANLKVCEFRNQCQQLKHELKIAQKALVNEVGEGVSVSSILSGGGGWRGRAQQIQTLQLRVAELSEKTSSTNCTEKEAKKAMSAARVAERELRAQHEKEVLGLKDQLDDRHKKLEAAKARSRVLENSLSEMRGRLTALLDKTSHDDQLITALTAQLAQVADKGQERSTWSRLEQQNKLLEQQLTEERAKFSHLQSALNEKEEEVVVLHEKYLKSQSPSNAELVEKSRSTSSDTAQTNNYFALETMGLAAEAERLRLLELLAVTNKRLEKERELTTQAQGILRRERHRAARLETKLARQELERVGARNSYHNPSPHKASDAFIEELKCKVELLEEELLYLRSRLTNVEQEKQEDLRSYTSMLENTRHAFTDAVRNINNGADYSLYH